MLTRRHFLATGAILTGGAAFLSQPLSRPAFAGQARGLSIGSRTLDVLGRGAKVYSLTDDAGRPGLVIDPGEEFNVNLTNGLDEETIIHWHGLTPPFEQDGVAGNPLPKLKAGESRSYNFAIKKPGTFWMHAHTLQEQNLLAAPLIVHSSEDIATDRQEVVVLLHDFSFTPAEELLAGLGPKPGTTMGGMNHDAMGKMGDMNHMGEMGGMGSMEDMGHMMGGMDLNDITYDAYLANDQTLDDPQIVSVEKSGRVLLRIINAASSTAFTLSTGTLVATVNAVDGRPVMPVTGNAFPLSMGQRIDLLVDIPKDGGAFPILALREGAVERTGIILTTRGAAIAKLPINGEAPSPVLDLTFESQLQSREPLVEKAADHAFMVHMMGSMKPYQWALMGEEGLSAKLGQRIEIAMMNMSMMSHPMHMHGHDFQVVDIDGQRFAGAVRDTVLVPPMRTVTIAIDIDNPGKWPFHCHHLYHMVTGMMTHIPVTAA